KIEATKDAFLSFLLDAKASGKQVAAYGAAAKGNTFLNFAGIRSDLIAYVVDRNPVKQGKYMPGSRIPIVDESRITESAPDYLVILPWNLRSEIVDQLAFIREWGGQFVVAIPNLSIVS
ncbi:MAG: methyltransferase C-terminal domain-containing protein, partial [Coraliomargarita sp.]